MHFRKDTWLWPVSFFISIVRGRHVRQGLGEGGRALLAGACLAFAPAMVSYADFQLGLTHHPGGVPTAAVLESLPVSWRNDLSWRLVEWEAGELAMPHGRIGAAWESVQRRRRPMLWILDYGNPLHTEGWIDTDEERVAFARYAEWAAENSVGSGRLAVGGDLSGPFGHPAEAPSTVVRQLPTAHRALEVWNEWDFGFGGPDGTGTAGDPVEYVKLLATTAEAIRAVDPNLTVVGGSISSDGFGDWLEVACEAGLLNHLDALSIHPYHSRHGGAYRLPEVGLLAEIGRVRAVMRRWAVGSGRSAEAGRLNEGTGDRGQESEDGGRKSEDGSSFALPPTLFPLRSPSSGGQVELRRTGRATEDRSSYGGQWAEVGGRGSSAERDDGRPQRRTTNEEQGTYNP